MVHHEQKTLTATQEPPKCKRFDKHFLSRRKRRHLFTQFSIANETNNFSSFVERSVKDLYNCVQ
jgi:hypothetical protein